MLRLNSIHLIILALSTLFAPVRGLSQDYLFSKNTAAYISLTATNSINNGVVWDDEEFTVPIGFDFELLGSLYSELLLTDGLLMFGQDNDKIISAFGYANIGADLIDRAGNDTISKSPINYELSGASGNRIFKIEWNNAGFYDDQNPYADSINFQLWLYESDGTIEIRFGPGSVDTSSYYLINGPIVGVGSYDYFFKFFIDGVFLFGPANIPGSVDTLITALTGTPDSGTVYIFTKNYSYIHPEKSEVPDNFIPSVIHDRLVVNGILSSDPPILLIYDLSGRLVFTGNLRDINNTIDVSSIPSGIYFLKLIFKERIILKKVIKN
ncbi:MAG: T9SS type A sorting domain-containing protein [Bacteroidetes bacterium]|nr:T9SS type A sorting domain-containing protein [Bacteroidota bacterium]